MEFPLEEYQGRVTRARALMAESNLDAIVVTGDYATSWNYRYLSGHLPRDFQSTPSRPHVLLLTREGGAALCAVHFGERQARESWVPNIHIYTQPFRVEDVLLRLPAGA